MQSVEIPDGFRALAVDERRAFYWAIAWRGTLLFLAASWALDSLSIAFWVFRLLFAAAAAIVLVRWLLARRVGSVGLGLLRKTEA